MGKGISVLLFSTNSPKRPLCGKERGKETGKERREKERRGKERKGFVKQPLWKVEKGEEKEGLRKNK